MKSILITSAFLASSVLGAARPPRAAAISTLTIEIPSQGVGFTSTVAGCGSVAPFAVVAVANGSFFPGTNTIFLPPQASPSTTTIVNAEESATQVLVAQPLEGECQDFPPSAAASITDISQLTATGTDGTPTATDSACPLGTLASTVSGAAEDVIDAINKVTLLSQNLQAAAKQIGGSSSSTNPKHRRNVDSTTTDLSTRQFNTPIIQVASGLRDVVTTLTVSIPRITVLPPFDPGDASDAIVIALISFVRVHQALLNILIGRAGLISNFPFADADVAELNAIAAESQTALEQFLGSSGQSMATAKMGAVEAGSSNVEARANPIGAPIAAALRAVEGVVDSLAFAIIDLIPSRNECAKDQKTAIDGTLQESIEAYS